MTVELKESRGSNCTATEHALVQRCTATEHATSVYSDALLQSMLLYDTKDSVWFVRARNEKRFLAMLPAPAPWPLGSNSLYIIALKQTKFHATELAAQRLT